MMEKIGIICQDAYSKGFLLGLQHRLECAVEIIEPPGSVGKTRNMTRKNARLAWAYFRRQGVDLVVRFTDADRARWQKVRRDECSAFPEESRDLMVCGVAVENVEDWLLLNSSYMARVLGVPSTELQDPEQRSDKVKKALKTIMMGHESSSDVVARIVKNVPSDVFRNSWLIDDSLRQLYKDCRSAAARCSCSVPNELDKE